MGYFFLLKGERNFSKNSFSPETWKQYDLKVIIFKIMQQYKATIKMIKKNLLKKFLILRKLFPT